MLKKCFTKKLDERLLSNFNSSKHDHGILLNDIKTWVITGKLSDVLFSCSIGVWILRFPKLFFGRLFKSNRSSNSFWVSEISDCLIRRPLTGVFGCCSWSSESITWLCWLRRPLEGRERGLGSSRISKDADDEDGLSFLNLDESKWWNTEFYI